MSNNKQSMKLYTEEQLKHAILLGRDLSHRFSIDELSTIVKNNTLPTDAEIEQMAPSCGILISNKAFIRGAKWMRDKIQGGNK